MTRNTENLDSTSGPEGSIFLPLTQNPTREFDKWYFELLTGRGIGRDLEEGVSIMLGEELSRMKKLYLGHTALDNA